MKVLFQIHQPYASVQTKGARQSYQISFIQKLYVGIQIFGLYFFFRAVQHTLKEEFLVRKQGKHIFYTAPSVLTVFFFYNQLFISLSLQAIMRNFFLKQVGMHQQVTIYNQGKHLLNSMSSINDIKIALHNLLYFFLQVIRRMFIFPVPVNKKIAI